MSQQEYGWRDWIECPDCGNPNVELTVRFFQNGVNVGFDCNDCECYTWTDGGISQLFH